MSFFLKTIFFGAKTENRYFSLFLHFSRVFRFSQETASGAHFGRSGPGPGPGFGPGGQHFASVDRFRWENASSRSDSYARADVRQHRIVLSVGRYDPPA